MCVLVYAYAQARICTSTPITDLSFHPQSIFSCLSSFGENLPCVAVSPGVVLFRCPPVGGYELCVSHSYAQEAACNKRLNMTQECLIIHLLLKKNLSCIIHQYEEQIKRELRAGFGLLWNGFLWIPFNYARLNYSFDILEHADGR